MYRRLLVPIDGSELAEIALDYVRWLVSRLPGTEVFLLHVRSPEERHLAPMRRVKTTYLFENLVTLVFNLFNSFGLGYYRLLIISID